MKDYLGSGAWINRPIHSKSQNLFRRFVRQPHTGLPDFLEDSRNAIGVFGNDRLRTAFTDMMRENGEHE